MFTRVRSMLVRFDELSSRLAKAYADVPEEEGLAEIDAAIARVRAGAGYTPVGGVARHSAQERGSR